jgi:hypothetical protein
MEAIMRVTVRGWGRDHGESEIINVKLGDTAQDADGYRYLGQGYLRFENEYLPKMAKAKLSAGTEPLRLGGRYLLGVELSRDEIAKLFFATHKGDLVELFKSLLEDEQRKEEEEERRQEAERRAAMLARHQRWEAQKKRRELLNQFGEKFASLNKRDGTASLTSGEEVEVEEEEEVEPEAE